MISIFSLSIAVSAMGMLLGILLPLSKNVRIAKASGLPYVLVPFFAYNRLTSLFMLRVVIRIANLILPKPSPTSARSLTTASWPWKLQYTPFAELGDTFLTVAPGGIILNTADADVISQIIARGADFPKASFLYKTVSIYGENILAAEGESWRRQRKIMTPLFSEKNNQLVWKQTLECCDAMVLSWTDVPDKTIRTLANDTQRLSLNVIEHAALGHHETWPKYAETQTNPKLKDGHKMTFHDSLTSLLDHLFYVILIPKWFLRNAPFASTRLANLSYHEWGAYMAETMEQKRASMELEKDTATTNDLLSQLVRASEERPGGRAPALSQSEILGNLYVMALAGHETSANSIHFSLILLSMHPQIQREVQKELDEIFRSRKQSSQWTYEHDFPRLLESKLAAVLNEQLRLFAPTIAIPKISNSVPQEILINGQEVEIPPKTMIRICVSSVHRNPNFWTKAPSKGSKSPPGSDLLEFRPERWMEKMGKADAKTGVAPRSTVPYEKGAYLPFSDGPRACIGRRFAQVEVLAGLARILSQYTVELAVDEWATTEQVAEMTGQEKQKIWEKAQRKATWNLQNKMMVLITLQLRGAHVPVRLVRRGEEVFANL